MQISKIAAIAVLALGLAGAAQAQSNSQSSDDNDPGTLNNPAPIAVPPAPAIIAAPPTIEATPVPVLPAPGLVPVAPPPDIDTGDATQPTEVPSPPAAMPGQAQNAAPDSQDQDIAPVPPNTWLPAQTAEIGVLDKIDGSVATLSIPVGGQSVVGDLQVSVQACMTRPPDQVPDAAVFLALQNASDASAPPNYRGWLVRSAPGAAVAGDASETFRVIGCS